MKSIFALFLTIILTTGCAQLPNQSSQLTEATPAVSMAVPESDCEIRLWYNYQVIAVNKVNLRWKDKLQLPLIDRAKRAYQIRHNARMNARFMMHDKIEVAALQKRDLEKYGNPNGPTFDYLLNKNIKKYQDKIKALQMIIQASGRTDNSYNQECDISK